MRLSLPILLCLINYCVCDNAVQEKISTAKKITEDILKSIHERWQVNSFPNFLRSAAISRTSWEVLKLKMQSKILSSILHNKPEKFTISFMGSSVTAGHDSPFNKSFPILTGQLMGPALAAAGLEVVSLNAAMGNNPCLPYDACVRTFAGPEADIVHWEQSYNCDGGNNQKRVEFEQFIRQALTLPSQPVVVFSTSDTPNWGEDKCPKDLNPIKLSEEDNMAIRLAESDPIKLVSDMNNKPKYTNHWQAMLEMFKSYKMAGIQMWTHGNYEDYKCQGPYVKNWGCCSASWHPSLLGHELRASHYAYFWLLIYKDALTEISSHLSDITAFSNTVKKHTSSEHRHLPATALYKTEYTDGIQCFTTYEPRNDEHYHLLNAVIPPVDPATAWKVDIMEQLMEPSIVSKARERGYKDFKYMIFGNKDSSPLNIRIKVSTPGTGYLCGPPGNWGRLPDGFKRFWDVGTKVFLTENVAEDAAKTFVFAADKTKGELKYTNDNPKDTQNLCVHFNEKLPVGEHVLTLQPTTDDKVAITYLLIP